MQQDGSLETTEDANVKSARVRSHALLESVKNDKGVIAIQFKRDAKRLVPVSATDAYRHRRCHA